MKKAVRKKRLLHISVLLNRYKWLKEIDMYCLPHGWNNTFMISMLEDINREIKKANIADYSVFEIKEKFGELRWYDNCCNDKIFKIINKYEVISRHTCARCGKFDVDMTSIFGWLNPYCEDCYRFIAQKVGDKEPFRLGEKCPESYTLIKFTQNGEQRKKYSIERTVLRLRRNDARNFCSKD